MHYKVALNIQVWINSEGKQAYECIKEIKKLKSISKLELKILWESQMFKLKTIKNFRLTRNLPGLRREIEMQDEVEVGTEDKGEEVMQDELMK